MKSSFRVKKLGRRFDLIPKYLKFRLERRLGRSVELGHIFLRIPNPFHKPNDADERRHDHSKNQPGANGPEKPGVLVLANGVVRKCGNDELQKPEADSEQNPNPP
jgi:hypothetical protein